MMDMARLCCVLRAACRNGYLQCTRSVDIDLLQQAASETRLSLQMLRALEGTMTTVDNHTSGS